MRLGNEGLGSRIRACQLPRHERGEVLFDGLEVASDPPGKAFVSEFAKPTQEALSTSHCGRSQLNLHSRFTRVPFSAQNRCASKENDLSGCRPVNTFSVTVSLWTTL